MRGTALIFAAWITFGLVQAAAEFALDRAQMPFSWYLGYHALLAAYWTAASLLISGAHRRIRARLSRTTAVVAAHAPLLILAMIGDAAARRFAVRALGDNTQVAFVVTVTYYADVVMVAYLAVILVGEVLRAQHMLVAQKHTTDRLAAQLSQARLEFLEAQLHPHFLFNSLGLVSELAHRAPASAARVIRQLRSVLEFALAGAAGEVPLGRELAALEPYLDIQRLRFADWLEIEQHVDPCTRSALVPRLVLQPLVENAIRHGLAGRTAPGRLVIVTRTEEDRLIVEVRDNGVGMSSRAAAGHGVGLVNVRERLRSMYDDGAALQLLNDHHPGTVARLSLPLRYSEAFPRAAAAGAAVSAEEPAATSLDHSIDALSARDGATVPARPRNSVAAIAIAWAVWGIIWSQQSVAYLALRHRLVRGQLLDILGDDMGSALLWAAFTLGAFAVMRRYPLTTPLRRGRAIAYLVSGVMVSLAQAVLARALFHPELSWITALALMTGLNLLIFWAVVAMGHRTQLLTWLREREASDAAVQAQLAETRLRTMAIRANPELLLGTLTRLSDLVVADSSRAERLIARLGDYLRLSLDAGMDRHHTVASDAALSHARMAVEREAAGPMPEHARRIS
jgi:two-component system, LytTR family, sensor kinase